MVPRNGKAPSCWLFSTVNMMAGSMLFICSRRLCLCSSCLMTKVSSTYLSQSLGAVVAVLRAVLSKCSMWRLATMGLTGDPIAGTSTCSQNWP